VTCVAMEQQQQQQQRATSTRGAAQWVASTALLYEMRVADRRKIDAPVFLRSHDDLQSFFPVVDAPP